MVFNLRKHNAIVIIALFIGSLLTGCASKPDSSNDDNNAEQTATETTKEAPQLPAYQQVRYQLKDDKAPVNPPSVEHVEDAHAQYEPYSLGGNKDYTLLGEDYKIVKNVKGFTQTGKASWYGAKFQGHQTSNGEVYDMYSMSAAHKTLPLPSYVKVTNLDNNKTTVVRINDRGPFHSGRIIDLSYAAAYKLGMLHHGVAHVKIDVLTFDKPTDAKTLAKHPRFVVQVLSSQHVERVRTLSEKLGQKLTSESFIDKGDHINRLLLGPFTDYALTQTVLEKVKLLGYPSAFIRTYTSNSK